MNVLRTKNNQVFIIRNTRDLYDMIDELVPDIAGELKDIIMEFEDEANDKIMIAEHDKKMYEMSWEALRDCLLEISSIIKDLENYLSNIKRINKNKIYAYIKHIQNLIYNEI